MAHGILSKGIKLYYAEPVTTGDPTYNVISMLQECPSLGGTKDKVETTTLDDGQHTYIQGLIEYGDLEFKFLYDNSAATSNYRICKTIEAEYEDEPELQHLWKVEFPDGTEFNFPGQAHASIDSQGTNVASTFTLSIALSGEITVTNPA